MYAFTPAQQEARQLGPPLDPPTDTRDLHVIPLSLSELGSGRGRTNGQGTFPLHHWAGSREPRVKSGTGLHSKACTCVSPASPQTPQQ